MGIELGIGESLIVKAIAQVTGRKPADIKADLLKVGDLGLVAEVGPALPARCDINSDALTRPM